MPPFSPQTAFVDEEKKLEMYEAMRKCGCQTDLRCSFPGTLFFRTHGMSAWMSASWVTLAGSDRTDYPDGIHADAENKADSEMISLIASLIYV